MCKILSKFQLLTRCSVIESLGLLPFTLASVVMAYDLSFRLGAWVQNGVPMVAMSQQIALTWVVYFVVGLLLVPAIPAGALAIVLLARALKKKLPFPQAMSVVAFAFSASAAAMFSLLWADGMFMKTQGGIKQALLATIIETAFFAMAWGVRLGAPVGFQKTVRAMSCIFAIPVLIGLGTIGMTAMFESKEPSSKANADVPPYVFLISIDALSSKHTSLHGYGRMTTPNIDRLAENSFVFDRMYANSNWTVSSIASLLTGVRPWSHRGINFTSTPIGAYYDDGLFSLTKAAGYANSAYVTNLNASPISHGGSRWFDRIRYPLASARGIESLWAIFDKPPSTLGARALMNLYDFVEASMVIFGIDDGGDQRDPGAVLKAMLNDVKVDQADGRRGAYWAHLYPPHAPYAAPAPYLGKYDQSGKSATRMNSTPPYAFYARQMPNFPGAFEGRYDESINYVDAWIGDFLSKLKDMGIYDKSLIILVADHGESFSHQYGQHGGPALHQELISVPLLIKLPEQGQMVRVWNVAEQVDLLPTIAELLGMQSQQDWEGKSLVPYMSENGEAKPIFAMNFQTSTKNGRLESGSVAMIDGDWKYVHYFGYRKGDFPVELTDELFDLSVDPMESKNMVADRREVAIRMKDAIEAELNKHRVVSRGL